MIERMDSDSQFEESLSPESTVTSLLSSSGRLKSSLLPPECTTTFRFKNKDYGSASDALDAYIADFDNSCQRCKSQTGRLVLPQSPPPSLRKPRNRDVLRESLTERELDYLNLPVSSVLRCATEDRLSMTTDDLLSIPHDGSLPVTRTSAFIQGLLSRSGAPTLQCPHSCKGCRSCAGLHHQLAQTPRCSRSRGQSGAYKDFPTRAHKRSAASEWVEPSFSIFPRMNRTSDLKCPTWVDDCVGSEPLQPLESKLWDQGPMCSQPAPRGGAPSWVEELEEDDVDMKRSQESEILFQVDSQLSLRDLRHQFDDHISRLAAERKSSDVMETSFRDKRIESLILKADQVLNSLCQSREAGTSVNAEELLTSSSHRPSSVLDSAAGGSRTTQNTGAETPDSCLPGPVEALKQMLFRLQAVEAKLQHQEGESPNSPRKPERLETEETPVNQVYDTGPVFQWTDGEADLDSLSGGLSLQRALHHLNRLKLLVEEPGEKRRKSEEVKDDDDEGRYSSSSADGTPFVLRTNAL
ncbi:lung adenoma susceptibility protein 2 isoform X3 [Cynoglossus semilaevis]|uniref:lung adenoma susceptibility protein 2 isoform X3 n=1 Tax=Cynoglossus semilaevis TaxID=244447 RepID=UPI000495E5BA|nr:uncharacterized protein LOC103389144 isoform X3 [Cynoglossus semilaevis]